MKYVRWGLLGVAGLAVVGVVATFVAARLVAPQHPLGVRDGALAPCPPSPNCVTTGQGTPDQQMQPLQYSGTPDAARAALVAAVQATGGTIVTEQPDYIHALYRSPTMGFPDDIEFYLPPTGGTVAFRAGARMGRSDLGVNRARMEAIGQVFAERVGN